jgi:membrane-associated protein
MSAILDALLAIASSPWCYVVLAGLLIVDGFFPFVPGETAVVALATLGAAGRGPQEWLVLIVAIAATMLGDGIAFAIGRRTGLSRWSWMRRARVQSMFAWAGRGLHGRTILFFVIAKFVPYARVLVTMTGGASRLPIPRYLRASLIAATVYTAYHVFVGTAAGTLFASNPLLATAIAIATVAVLGVVAEMVNRAIRRRRERRELMPEALDVDPGL